MTLFDTIQQDIKVAMLSKNNVKRDVLRTLVSDIKNITINAGKEITDDATLKCIQKSVKQHHDSIDQFTAANRNDLVTKEQEELSYLEVYLPKMMTEEETYQLLITIIANEQLDMTKKSMGVIMKLLPSDADKKIASKILSQLLK